MKHVEGSSTATLHCCSRHRKQSFRRIARPSSSTPREAPCDGTLRFYIYLIFHSPSAGQSADSRSKVSQRAFEKYKVGFMRRQSDIERSFFVGAYHCRAHITSGISEFHLGRVSVSVVPVKEVTHRFSITTFIRMSKDDCNNGLSSTSHLQNKGMLM